MPALFPRRRGQRQRALLAVGVTTGIPGYFLSSSVKNAAGELLGVLVVKLELEDMQRDWVGQPGILLIADSLDIVILTNRPAWRFRYLRPLSDEVRSRLVDVRRYAEQTLQPLQSSRVQQLDEGSERRLVDGPDGRREYLWQRLALPRKTGPCTCCMTRSRSPPVCAAIAWPRPAYG